MITIENFIKPEVVEIGDKKVTVSCLPAIDGKKAYNMIMDHDDSNFGMITMPEEISSILRSRCALMLDGGAYQILTSKDSVNNNFTVEELILLDLAMVKKNFGFLFNGGLQKALAALNEKTQDLKK